MERDASVPGVQADLVLEAGGVKGAALVGAVAELGDAGYRFARIAGSSAGAVAAALTAGLAAAGEPPGRVAELARQIELRRLPDRRGVARLGPPGAALAVLLHDGVYAGRYLRDRLGGLLRELGVATFGDLRLPPDPGGDLPPERRYRLVTAAADLSRRRLARLPWDAAAYGLDPDDLPVADAVVASAAIPFVFRPVRLAGATLVDGALLSQFPIGLFDRRDGRVPRWPTFGVRLSAHRPPSPRPVRGPLALGRAAVATVLEAGDAPYVDDPCVQRRSIFVDTDHVSPLAFDLPVAGQEALVDQGCRAASAFLATWDFAAYLRECRT